MSTNAHASTRTQARARHLARSVERYASLSSQGDYGLEPLVDPSQLYAVSRGSHAFMARFYHMLMGYTC